MNVVNIIPNKMLRALRKSRGSLLRVGFRLSQSRRSYAESLSEDEEAEADAGIPSHFGKAGSAALFPKVAPEILGFEYEKLLGEELRQQSRLDVMLANGEQQCAVYCRAAEPLWKKLKGKSKGAAFKKALVENRDEITRPVVRGLLLQLLKNAKHRFAWWLSFSMIEERWYELEQMDYLFGLALAATFAVGQARDLYLFNKLPPIWKTREAYHALLAGYVKSSNRLKAERVIQELKDLGLYTETFALNQMLLLHHSPELSPRISHLLKEAESLGVPRDVHSYNIYMASYSKEGKVRNVDEVLGMLQADPNVRPNESTYFIAACGYLSAGCTEDASNFLLRIEQGIQSGVFKRKQATFTKLLRLYGDLKDREGVESMWSILKSRPLKATDSYSYAIEAFGKLEDVRMAQEVFATSDGLTRTKQVLSMLAVYSSRSMMPHARSLFRALPRKNMKDRATLYQHLIAGYLRDKDEKKALEAFRYGRRILQDRCATELWYGALLTIMEHYANKGDVLGAEECFQSCKSRKQRFQDIRVFRLLLRAYINAKAPLAQLLNRIDRSRVTIDPETRELMKELRSKQSTN